MSLKAGVRGLALIGVVGACVGLAIVLFSRNMRHEHVALPVDSVVRLHSFQTASYDEDRLKLRVSGDSLTLSKARLWGPFRLGFAHSLLVRNLTVEIFPDPAADSHTDSLPLSLKRTWTSVAPSLHRLLQSLLSKSAGGVIVSAQISPLHVIEQRSGQSTVLLKAASCQTARALTRTVCTSGFVRMGKKNVPFREWRPSDSKRKTTAHNSGSKRTQQSLRS